MINQTNFISAIERTAITVTKGKEALEKYDSGALPDSFILEEAAIIKTLSENYTRKEQDKVLKISSTAQARAYSLYYLPINAFKLFSLLSQLKGESSSPPLNTVFSQKGVVQTDSEALTVLDFGCGPATAAFALGSLFAGNLLIDGVDFSASMLALAEKLVKQHFGSDGRVQLKTSTRLADTSKKQYDLVLASNVICELPSKTRDKLIEQLYHHLAPTGLFVIVEPALRTTTRRLMQVRGDLLLRHPNLRAVFPCTHCNSCPMLAAGDNDWCHATLSWDKPQLVAQLDRLSGFNKHRLKYSTMVFRNNGSRQTDYRLIRAAAKTKIGRELLLCGEDFFGYAVLPKRYRQDTYHTLEKAKSFSRIVIKNWVNKPIIAPPAEVNAL